MAMLMTLTRHSRLFGASAPRVAPCAVAAGCSAGYSEEAGPTAVPSFEHMPRPEGVIGRVKVMIVGAPARMGRVCAGEACGSRMTPNAMVVACG